MKAEYEHFGELRGEPARAEHQRRGADGGRHAQILSQNLGVKRIHIHQVLRHAAFGYTDVHASELNASYAAERRSQIESPLAEATTSTPRRSGCAWRSWCSSTSSSSCAPPTTR